MEWGRERARAGPWRGNGRIAYLTPAPGGPAPSIGFLRRCLHQLAAQGYATVITSALAPAEQAAFSAVGFEEQERLRLLSHDLVHLPAAPEVPHRRARAADRPAVLAIDTVAFPPFWQLDGVGLDEALGATPASRFRVALDDRGRVVAYAVSGRSRGQGYLQRLAVDPAHRRGGIGRALALDGLRWMRRRGVDRAVVNTQYGNEAALCLYLALGFREEPWGLSVLRRDLGP
jgi:ribosomal protein S18 acetylase RimI-like enzyme